eukprot:PhF_6_TR18056/c0_g1_i1/m.26908
MLPTMYPQPNKPKPKKTGNTGKTTTIPLHTTTLLHSPLQQQRTVVEHDNTPGHCDDSPGSCQDVLKFGVLSSMGKVNVIQEWESTPDCVLDPTPAVNDEI